MTTTLVIGGPRNGTARHARSLFSGHPQVTCVVTADEDGADQGPGTPDGWRVVRTRDLSRALLGSRHPVLVDDLTCWLRGILDDQQLWDDPAAAHETVEDRLAELTVAASAMPFDVVVLSAEPSWSPRPTDDRDALFVDLLEHTNERVSAVSGQVHAILAGRVLDLSDAALVGR
ncbi:bifunctional adenosylcobinamide kinase/adenosylcobinamide-phosphate guanylyltransferase [Ornithinimicrobium sp. W1679]|uniref:bifunctional adenosylcobinamide kinase/adenosylcobinamide-phosphate guanylyltransferase n=1 Tax=Ornithinimicrobium sp. W1679 TaxID=3418770 RepID=UPI003CE81C7B